MVEFFTFTEASRGPSEASWRSGLWTAVRRLSTPAIEFIARRHLCSADTTTLLVPPTRRVTLGDRAFQVAAARAWNSLPTQIRAASSLLSFRRQTKAHLFQLSYN